MDARAGTRAPSEICLHSEIRELRSGEPNLVPRCASDIAIARINVAESISSWQGDDARGYDTPVLTSEPVSQMRVKKFGRTTGLTTGVVEAFVNTPTPIPYSAKHFKARVWFENVWTVKGDGEPFAMPGDSGSVVVTEDNSAVVGLVFAANADWGWIIPISCIITEFGGLEFVTGHGV